MPRPPNYDNAANNFMRVYIDLKTETSHKLNVYASEHRTSKKQFLEKLVEEFFANEDKKHGKKK
jgi:predicted DsbA family dithiol-disulfide isomerase